MTTLRPYVDAWQASITTTADLVSQLTESELLAPTDCPGWSVRDVVAHLAHLEHVLTGESEGPVDGLTVPSDYTDAGVDARRELPFAQVLEELRTATAARTAFLAELPDDASQPAPVTPAGAPWSWDTLLRNRALDAWVHEQDIRRAVDQPGGLDTAGAFITTMTFAAGMSYVLGKKVGAPAGTSVRWEITGPVALGVGAVVGDDGRARRDDAIIDPTTTLTLSTEAFTVLAAGRRGPEALEVKVEGDAELGRAILDQMALTF